MAAEIAVFTFGLALPTALAPRAFVAQLSVWLAFTLATGTLWWLSHFADRVCDDGGALLGRVVFLIALLIMTLPARQFLALAQDGGSRLAFGRALTWMMLLAAIAVSSLAIDLRRRGRHRHLWSPAAERTALEYRIAGFERGALLTALTAVLLVPTRGYILLLWLAFPFWMSRVKRRLADAT